MLIIIQARTGSTRLPNKVLANLNGKPIIQHVVDICRTQGQTIVAIPEIDDPLSYYLYQHKIPFYEGSENDVLKRYLDCATTYRADNIVRITADCPVHCEAIIGYLIHLHSQFQADFTTNVFPPRTVPDGWDCEIMSYRALMWLNQNANSKEDREHVTAYLYRHKEQFEKAGMRLLTWKLPVNLSHIKISVDTKEDLENIKGMMI